MEGVNTEISNVPLEPPVNRYGFLLPAVMKEEYIFKRGSTRCTMCINGCRPNRHHLYWPEFKKNKNKTLVVRGETIQVPDYRGDALYGSLRREMDNIVTVCAPWHNSLHKFQQPPTELPDRDSILTFLEQARFFREVESRCRILVRTPVSQRGVINDETKAKLNQESDLITGLLKDFPNNNDIVIPREGYWCSRVDDEKAPEVFNPDNLRNMLSARVDLTSRLINI